MMNFIKFIKYYISLGKVGYRYFIQHKPVHKSFDLTYRCNLFCNHCYFYKNNSKVETDPISDEEWEVIFKKEKESGISDIYFTGGEPMLRPRVIETATQIFGAGRVNVVTNGTIKIPSYWKNNIYVSIDGDAETQKQIRGGDILDGILNNIRNNKRVVISATITRLNYKKIKAIYRIAKDANVKGVSFSFYTAKSKEDSLDESIIDEAIDSLREIKKLDPDYVFVTEKMFEVLKKKSHVKNCVIRNSVVSHLPNMDIKKPCIFGEGIDCSTCGCHLPIFLEGIKRLDIETLLMMRKVFS